jgi:hypothetical protein
MFFLSTLEGIHAQVDDKGCAQGSERLLPYAQTFGLLGVAAAAIAEEQKRLTG